jgi:HK97 family phage portal protein
MTWPFARRSVDHDALLATRTGLRSNANGRVTRNDALRHSAVWACLRLRADLMSTMPVDVFRRVDGVQVEQTKPPVIVAPGAPLAAGQAPMSWTEWFYATQIDLDSVGNTFGIITARDGQGRPSQMELVEASTVTVIGKGAQITKYRIGQVEYEPQDVWHERQFVASGVPLGLSPIAYAAMTLNVGISAREFAAAWFSNSAVPSGHLKNSERVLNKAEAASTKANFKASVAAGDVWVSGRDWEFEMLAAKASESQFLESYGATILDICRFLGVPGDMIDAEVASGSITYANVTQRNLQLLIMNIGPAIYRREDAISRGLLAAPRYIKLNPSALLRMDVKSRYDAHKVAIDSRIYPPSRALDLENMAPLTPEEEAEFARLFPVKAQTPAAQTLKSQPIEQNFRIEMPAVDLPDVRMEVHTPDVVVEAPDVRVDNHVHVPRQAAPEVRIEPAAVSAPNVHVDVHVPEQQPPDVRVDVNNDVKPAEVVLPKRRRKVIHDTQGRVTETIEEDM